MVGTITLFCIYNNNNNKIVFVVKLSTYNLWENFEILFKNVVFLPRIMKWKVKLLNILGSIHFCGIYRKYLIWMNAKNFVFTTSYMYVQCGFMETGKKTSFGSWNITCISIIIYSQCIVENYIRETFSQH